jgi:autoinducer 2-degrading protein
MYVVCVTAFARADRIQEYIDAILDNARNSRLEPGNARFDVLQGDDDPTRFTFYEAYHTPEDFGKHQQTEHYLRWRSAVEELSSQPRTNTKNRAVFFGERAV